MSIVPGASDILALATRPSPPTPDEAREILKARGILVREFADALGVHPVTVYNWLAGRQEPTGMNRDRYATALALIVAIDPDEAASR